MNSKYWVYGVEMPAYVCIALIIATLWFGSKVAWLATVLFFATIVWTILSVFSVMMYLTMGMKR